jgi:hypothetical protein
MLDEDQNKVATLAMWDTGNALTNVCAEYLRARSNGRHFDL